ncbi:hypothetical protein ACFJIW_00140 [Tahibacter sp. UC22_41]|uniref:hypothetical protein n=1 Tax=Tahibacter sp. UC22_41 TaxID=3350178 RepID=UPI0036D9648D
MIRVPLLATALLLLAACTTDDKPAAQTSPPPRQPTVVDPQLQALQRAKAVQDTVDAQKAATDAKLREAEGQ